MAISISILALSGQILIEGLDSCLFVGELSLDGYVMPVRGEVAYAMLARDCGFGLSRRMAIIQLGCQGSICIASGIFRRCALALRALSLMPLMLPLFYLAPSVRLWITQTLRAKSSQSGHWRSLRQEAWGLMMVGPPESGKTMLAERMGTILPPIDEVELQEALCIHSVEGRAWNPCSPRAGRFDVRTIVFCCVVGRWGPTRTSW